MALNTMRDNMGTKLDNVDNKSSLPIIIGLAERAPYIVHNLKLVIIHLVRVRED